MAPRPPYNTSATDEIRRTILTNPSAISPLLGSASTTDSSIRLNIDPPSTDSVSHLPFNWRGTSDRSFDNDSEERRMRRGSRERLPIRPYSNNRETMNPYELSNADWSSNRVDAASGSNRIMLARRRLSPHSSFTLGPAQPSSSSPGHISSQHLYSQSSNSIPLGRRRLIGTPHPTYARPFSVPSYLLHSYNSSRFFTMELAKEIDSMDSTTPHDGERILLPTCWDAKSVLLDLASDGVNVRFGGTAKYGDRDAAAILANQPIDPSLGIYYFEVMIISKGHSGYIGIGLSGGLVSLNRLPGWEKTSWGYHGDDGRVFECSGTGRLFGPQFTTGDVVGCGIDFTQQNQVFFTKNGEMIGSAFKNVTGPLYPSVGLITPGEQVEANFGSEPFKFDIDLFTKNRIESITISIESTPLPSSFFAPSPLPLIPSIIVPPESTRVKETMESLIADYLLHHGYVKTAQSFNQQVGEARKARFIDLNSPLGPISIPRDESITLPTTTATSPLIRMEIRQFLLEGAATEALGLLELHYPALVSTLPNSSRGAEEVGGRADIEGDDGILLLRLKLQIFIEAVASSRSLPSSSDRKGKSRSTATSEDLILSLGQSLDGSYRSDPRPEVREALMLTFSLLAYEEPEKEVGSVGELLSQKKRESLADFVNSAILGKDQSELETVYRQMSAVVTELAQHNVAGSVFVNPRKMLGLV